MRNIELKTDVKFSPKVHNTQIQDRTVFAGRTHTNFKTGHSNELNFAEMETVKSARSSSKCILTFYFPQTESFLAYLLNRCTPGAVKAVFD